MKLYTYLNYGGNCREAFEFYQEHLGGKITMMMKHSELPPPQKPIPGWEDRIVHARMELGDTLLLGADIPPERFKPLRSAYLTLVVDTSDEAERIYKLFANPGEIFVPMEENFYAYRFAMVSDRFGTSWMLMHEKPMG